MSRLTTKQRRARRRGRRRVRVFIYGSGRLFVGGVEIGAIQDFRVDAFHRDDERRAYVTRSSFTVPVRSLTLYDDQGKPQAYWHRPEG